MNTDNINPDFDNENRESDKRLREGVEGIPAKDNLNYNAEDNSFEYDVKSEDPEYDHPDPYNTAAKNGSDMDSTYDEANPYDTVDEYIPNESLETDVDQLGMHIDNGESVEVDPVDEALARTPEDDRDDLDEEGYPKNDTPNKPA
jgi:hypothetical protein